MLAEWSLPWIRCSARLSTSRSCGARWCAGRAGGSSRSAACCSSTGRAPTCGSRSARIRGVDGSRGGGSGHRVLRSRADGLHRPRAATRRRGHRARRAGRRVPRRLDRTADGARAARRRPAPRPTRSRCASSRTLPAVVDYGRVVALANDDPGERERAPLLFHDETIIAPHIAAFVAYMGAEPVACAMTLVSHRVAGVFYVATVEHARRRGLGDALTRMAARTGFEMGAGRSLARSLGDGRRPLPAHRLRGPRLNARGTRVAAQRERLTAVRFRFARGATGSRFAVPSRVGGRPPAPRRSLSTSCACFATPGRRWWRHAVPAATFGSRVNYEPYRRSAKTSRWI